MFRTAGALLLQLAHLALVLGSPAGHDATSLLQVDHLTAVRHQEQDRQQKYLADIIERYQAAAKQQTSQPTSTKPWPVGNSSFVSADGLLCIESTARGAEGALALKKAGVIGKLYDNVTVQPGTCASRGYTLNGGVDHCDDSANVYVNTAADGVEFANREFGQMVLWGMTYGLDVNTTMMMFECTCTLNSAHRIARGSQCLKLNSMTGAWIHHAPGGGPGLICDEGPFTTATWALAVQKSTRQYPMHLHDNIAATTCASLGFPYVYPPIDHCFPPMRMWMATPDMMTDPGVITSAMIEQDLFGGAADKYFVAQGMNVNVLGGTQIPGCHCLVNSTVFTAMSATCQFSGASPPIRDWWKQAVELR